MENETADNARLEGISSGPLRVYEQDGRLFVVGFGLKIPVDTRGEGEALILELEEQGYKLCY